MRRNRRKEKYNEKWHEEVNNRMRYGVKEVLEGGTNGGSERREGGGAAVTKFRKQQFATAEK